jgi:hypothetical protein
LPQKHAYFIVSRGNTIIYNNADIDVQGDLNLDESILKNANVNFSVTRTKIITSALYDVMSAFTMVNYRLYHA